MKILFLSLTFLISLNSYSQNSTEENKNVVVQYKKYESFDLGELEVKGRIIAPGDLSVKERSRKVFKRDLYERYNFDQEIKEDIKNLR
ncbi:MAG: hypothetical protein ACPGJV_07280 [Bacteriovoracaceae bacterium]